MTPREYVQRWAENRLTRDVDVCRFTALGRETAFIGPLLASFEARRPDAADLAEAHRVLLLRSTRGTGIDINMAGLPFELELIQRSSMYEFTDRIQLEPKQ